MSEYEDLGKAVVKPTDSKPDATKKVTKVSGQAPQKSQGAADPMPKLSGHNTKLENKETKKDEDGKYFILPAHSYGLGVALEKMNVPPTITVICLGKSTYARLGIIVNTTPAEASWEGHLTLEFSNSSGADCRIYADEGICQLLFFEGDPCETPYSTRQGKYQYQHEKVNIAKV